MNILKSAALMLVLPGLATAQAQQAPQLGKAPVSEVVAAMTPEEKVSLITGTGMPGFGGPVVGETFKLVPGAAGTTADIPRLGIPAIVLADGPAGLRISPTRENDTNTYHATAFPIASLLASSWDLDLVNRVGQAMGKEVLEYGVDVFLAPALNIHRNPLGGRNFEYYSEDPLVAGKMTAAMVNGVEENGVGTSIKHFAANNHESNRMEIDVQLSERALREIYLKGFKIAVQESQPWTVMTSYNKINGTYTSESQELLMNILRQEWGFDGVVMTDWFAGKNPVAQVKAGNDLLMPGIEQQRKAILEGLKSGSLDQKALDDNVTRILELILKSPRFKGYTYSNKPDLKAHAQVAREAAAEGMVLLKNNQQALPLAKKLKNVAAFGQSSYDIVIGGTGSGDVNEAYSVSLIDGLTNAGLRTNPQLRSTYEAYLTEAKAKRPKQSNPFAPVVPIPEMPLDQQLIDKMAAEADVALITIGRSSGEFADRKREDDYELSSTEKELIQGVTSAFKAKGKKAIVVLNIGGVIETASWKDQPDAILLSWQPGQEAGNAITDILTGKINPSGKLATTFPIAYDDVPSSGNFPGLPANKPLSVAYEDGLCVGYRHFDTKKVEPSYAFGHGLSYTTFEYNNLKLSANRFDGKLTAQVQVKNTGKQAGKEVVQLYLTAPSGKLKKPVQELKGFAKTKLLKPGESQTLSFTLSPEDLASFDPAASAWVAEAGEYGLKLGSSSRNIRLSDKFSLDNELVVEKVNKVLVPQTGINELE